MESLERFVMLATSNDITGAALDHGHVSKHTAAMITATAAGATVTAAQESLSAVTGAAVPLGAVAWAAVVDTAAAVQ